MAGPFTASMTRARPGRRALTRLALLASVVLLLLLFAATALAAPGKLLYAKRIGSSSTTEAGASAVAAGPKGVTALAGGQEKSNVIYPMVAKYRNGGKRAWLKTYTPAGSGNAEDVAFDPAGNVYVAATVNGGAGDDIVVLKYSARGAFRWATTPYDGGSSGDDEVEEMAVDGAGNVVVLGESDASGKTGVVLLKYDKAGKSVWAEPARWDPPAGDPDAGPYWVDELVLDATGNVYVAGSTEYKGLENAVIAKFLGGDGTRQVGRVYGPRHADSSYFEDLAIRGSSLIATGSIWTKGVYDEDALAVKFSLGLKEKYWKEWGVGNKSEEWFGEAVLDGNGNVYVTGDQWVEPVYGKAVTLKLNARLSKVLWKKTYMPASKDAEAWNIVRDGAGNLYVSGVKNPHVGQASFLTLKYSGKGVRKWVRTWTGGGPGDDEPNDLVLGTKDGVYVGGDAYGKGGILQGVLLKYQR